MKKSHSVFNTKFSDKSINPVKEERSNVRYLFILSKFKNINFQKIQPFLSETMVSPSEFDVTS